MKTAIVLLLCAGSSAWAQLGGEQPSCFINKPILQASQGGITNTLRVNATDSNNPTGTNYLVDLSLDDQTFSVAANIVSGTASGGGTFVYQMAPGPWGTGSANVFDTAQHMIWGRMHSNFNGLILCQGFPIPFKYDSASAAGTYTYPNLTSTFSSTLTPSNLSVVVSSGDAYSTGSSVGGTLVCTVGSSNTAVYDNGVVGYYVKKYGVPCANLSVASGIAGNNYLTPSQATTMYAGLDPPILSGAHGIALGWVLASAIFPITSTSSGGTMSNYMSISAFFAFGGTISQRYVIYSTGAVRGSFYQSINNTYFQTPTDGSCSSIGTCPTMMLAYAVCSFGNQCTSGSGGVATGTWTADFPTAKASIDASFAAYGTAPTGGKIYHLNATGDFTRSSSYTVSPPLAVGTDTGICSNSLHCVVSDNAAWTPPFNQTNILATFVSSTNPIPSASTATYIAPGVGFSSNMTSGGGDFSATPNGTTGEAPCLWHVGHGAPSSQGLVEEPVGMLFNYYSEVNLWASYYSHGARAVQAAWASSRQPGSTNFIGDPLNCPYCSTAPPPTVGTAIVMLALGAALSCFLGWKVSLV